MCVTKRMRWEEGIYYIIAQTIGAIIGAGILALIAHGTISGVSSLGQNVVAGNYSLSQAFLAEVIATMIFVRVVLGVTSSKEPNMLAGLVIGLTLVLIHIVFIPVTGTSVNPARSTGPALFVGGEALNQLWIFWVAPILGAILAGIAHKACNDECINCETHNEKTVEVRTETVHKVHK